MTHNVQLDLHILKTKCKAELGGGADTIARIANQETEENFKTLQQTKSESHITQDGSFHSSQVKLLVTCSFHRLLRN